MESVGFQEWALVCEALGSGEQCILIRKGGIAEGRNGFGFRHTEFFLFPTFYHEQVGKIRLAGAQIPDRHVQLALLVYNRGPQAVQHSRAQGLDPSNGYERVVMKGYTGRGVID